ncbi:Beta-glucuronosyltransferase GlcAT14B [Asimina triloba]
MGTTYVGGTRSIELEQVPEWLSSALYAIVVRCLQPSSALFFLLLLLQINIQASQISKQREKKKTEKSLLFQNFGFSPPPLLLLLLLCSALLLRALLPTSHSSFHLRPLSMERRWIVPLSIASILSLVLLFLTTLYSTPLSLLAAPTSVAGASAVFVESKLHVASVSALPPPPRLAYLISGSAGDGQMLKRTLQALYHPINQYVVHLDLESSPDERLDLHDFVASHPVFARFGNVRMITKANLVTYRGPTMVSNTLHAAAVLLKEGGDWDWFINLSASDYPLVTQDGVWTIPISFDCIALLFVLPK